MRTKKIQLKVKKTQESSMKHLKQSVITTQHHFFQGRTFEIIT